MVRNPAAQTAVGPVLLVALEQSEPPSRRLVDDDLAARFLPAPTRWVVSATPPNLMRRLAMSVMEREGSGLWASMTCRKRYIADKVSDALGNIDDYRTFFVWEAVTQYLTADAVHATLEGLRSVAPGSRLVFTYVRRDFIDGVNLYGAESLYRRFRQRQRLWDFGLLPEEVGTFLDGHGWRLIEQAGPDLIVKRYVEPSGRDLPASQVEWSAYAEKT
jgi:O-methyltransferase involved in polyketide biosynthesis